MLEGGIAGGREVRAASERGQGGSQGRRKEPATANIL